MCAINTHRMHMRICTYAHMHIRTYAHMHICIYAHAHATHLLAIACSCFFAFPHADAQVNRSRVPSIDDMYRARKSSERMIDGTERGSNALELLRWDACISESTYLSEGTMTDKGGIMAARGRV